MLKKGYLDLSFLTFSTIDNNYIENTTDLLWPAGKKIDVVCGIPCYIHNDRSMITATTKMKRFDGQSCGWQVTNFVTLCTPPG